MDSFKNLYYDLLSNYNEVVVNLSYVTRKTLQSKYFSPGICNGGEFKNLEINAIDVRSNNNKLTKPNSVCFPNGYNSNPDIVITCSHPINALLISTILMFDDIHNHINLPTYGTICKQGIFIGYEHKLTGMLTPSKFAGLVPDDMILMESNATQSYTTVTDKFILNFIEQVTDVLALLGYYYDVVHGNLTHECITFDGLNVIIGAWDYASLSYVNEQGSLIRIRGDPEGITPKLLGEYVPKEVLGPRFKLEPEFLWDQRFRKLQLPYYRSFDYYTLILSCLSIEYFFVKVMNNYLLKSIIFDPLFAPEQASNVYIELYTAVKRGIPLQFNQITYMLKRYTLTCDALDVTRDRLTKLKQIILL